LGMNGPGLACGGTGNGRDLRLCDGRATQRYPFDPADTCPRLSSLAGSCAEPQSQRSFATHSPLLGPPHDVARPYIRRQLPPIRITGPSPLASASGAKGRSTGRWPLRRNDRTKPPPELHPANELRRARPRPPWREHAVKLLHGLRQPLRHRLAGLRLDGYSGTDGSARGPPSAHRAHCVRCCPRSA
jgi:hypothetical protein